MAKREKETDKELRFFAIPKMIPLLAKYKKPLIWMCIADLIAVATDIISPVLQRYALNHFVVGNTLDTLPQFIAVSLLVILVMIGSNYAVVRLGVHTEMNLDRDMRNKAFEHLQTLAFSYYNQNSVGYIHSRVMSDTSKIGDLFTWQIQDTITFTVYIIGSLGVMYYINPKLTGIILIIVPVIGLFFTLFYPKHLEYQQKGREINSKITGKFNEGITGAKTTKTLVIEDKMENDFKATTKEMYDMSFKSAKLRGVFGAVSSLATSMALAIILWKGGIIASDDVGTFSLFMTYAQNLMEPVNWLVATLALFVTGKVNITRYSKLVETVSDVTDSPEVTEKYGDAFNAKKENWEDIKGDIEFKNVDFKYPDGDEYVLEDFNLKIPFGTNVAIVGETGAGKSTLASLICRFYEPTKGQVLIDGKDARERSQLWLHSALGYVLQTPHLFSGTIRENLTYANEGATDEEIMDAIKLVSAEGVIAKLENGLDTEVGEGGDLLSTGEKQLISFARAILAKPKIIVLDEATASVDTITEQKIQSAIDTVIKGRTSIVIAHRLSTVRNADIILVVDKGHIIERGKHEELLAAKGHYYELWTRQYEEDATAGVLEKK